MMMSIYQKSRNPCRSLEISWEALELSIRRAKRFSSKFTVLNYFNTSTYIDFLHVSKTHQTIAPSLSYGMQFGKLNMLVFLSEK